MENTQNLKTSIQQEKDEINDQSSDIYGIDQPFFNWDAPFESPD